MNEGKLMEILVIVRDYVRKNYKEEKTKNLF